LVNLTVDFLATATFALASNLVASGPFSSGIILKEIRQFN